MVLWGLVEGLGVEVGRGAWVGRDGWVKLGKGGEGRGGRGRDDSSAVEGGDL